jgi:hypothetical protein
MSYLLYYRSHIHAKEAVEWFKKHDMHGDITHDIITLKVENLSQDRIAEIKQATGFTNCLDEEELPAV